MGKASPNGRHGNVPSIAVGHADAEQILQSRKATAKGWCSDATGARGFREMAMSVEGDEVFELPEAGQAVHVFDFTKYSD